GAGRHHHLPGGRAGAAGDPGGPRRAAPPGVRPRDRRRRDAGAAGRARGRGRRAGRRRRGVNAPQQGAPPEGSSLPRQGSLRWSFTWAFEGIVYVLQTQRNMQIHTGAAVVALTAGLLLDFSRLEMAVMIGAISLVLVAEMVNTAIEA